MKQQKTKNVLLGFLMLLLLAPLLNQQLHLIDSGKLHGAVTGTVDTAFTPEGWWNGTWQERRNAWVNDSIGFRADFVRLNNQIDFSLFRKTHAGGVVVGRKNYLYEEGYIRHYLGLVRDNDEEIRKDMLAARFVQDTLAKAGVQFLIVHAPSKAAFYPEFFPPAYDGKRQPSNNQRAYVRLADSLGVHQLDFNRWFADMRAHQQHLLMSKQGTHWTLYGCYVAADSLLRYLGPQLPDGVPEMVWNGGEETGTPRGTDNDLAAGMNLIAPCATETFYYPVVSFREDSTKKKPAVIYIGDSFFWTFIANGIPQHAHEGWQFWYYFNERWTNEMIAGREQLGHIADYNWPQAMTEADAVVVLCTDPNLTVMLRNFIRKAYTAFAGKPLE